MIQMRQYAETIESIVWKYFTCYNITSLKMNLFYREKKKKNGNTKMNLTGKPSVDKPWLQFYPEQLRNVEVPKMTIEEFLEI